MNKMIRLLLLPIASGIQKEIPNRRVRPFSRHVVHWDRLEDPSLSSIKILTVKMYDYIDFICPTRNPANSRYISRLERRHNTKRGLPVKNFTVHQMRGETGFALCDTNQSQIILECKAATSAKENKFSVRIQRKSAQPNALVFKPNTTYYYLSKNINNNEIERLNESQCQTGRTSHMRLKVIVEPTQKIGKSHAIGTVSRLTDSNRNSSSTHESVYTILLLLVMFLIT